MKEAAGEANMTVITIVLIGVLAAAAALFIPRIIANMKAQSCCTEQGGTYDKGTGKCVGGTMNGKTVAEMGKQDACKQ